MVQQKMCGNKRQFMTKREARSRARTVRIASGERMDSYWCPFCNFFHLGHARGKG